MVQRCSVCIFLAFAIVVNTNFRHLKLRPSQGTVANFIFCLFATLGWASILLQSYNVALLGAFWPFFAGISLHLLAAILQFARMMLLPPE